MDIAESPYYQSLRDTPFLYPYGLPFSKILALNIDALFDRIKRKKPSMIIFDGGSGEGKTTLAIHAGDYSNIKYGNGEPIALDKDHVQLALGGKEFGEKLLICHDIKFVVVIYDEAGDFDKKTTLSRFNRNLMRIFEQYRGFKILVILCLPRFYKLENELFELGISRLLVHCENRTEKQGSFRGFDLEQMFYIKYHAQKIIVKTKCYDYGMPNFYGHFLDLPPERSKLLDELSTKAKRRDIKRTVYDVRDRLTAEMIAKNFGKSKRWVLMKIRELEKMEELDVKLFERKKWYEKDILKKIDELEE